MSPVAAPIRVLHCVRSLDQAAQRTSGKQGRQYAVKRLKTALNLVGFPVDVGQFAIGVATVEAHTNE